MNLFIVYELDTWSQDLSVDFASNDFFFGSLKLSKNTDPNKYQYSGYGIGFNSRSIFSIPHFDWDKNVIIRGVDMSSSVHTNNKTKKYLSSWS